MHRNLNTLSLSLAMLVIALSLNTASAQNIARHAVEAKTGLDGTCNSKKGCKVLKRACLKAKGTYQDVDNGSDLKGTCSDSGQATVRVPAQTGGPTALVANTGPVEDAYCYTKTFCSQLKQVCSNYKKLGRNKGVCRD